MQTLKTCVLVSTLLTGNSSHLSACACKEAEIQRYEDDAGAVSGSYHAGSLCKWACGFTFTLQLKSCEKQNDNGSIVKIKVNC